jgi:hypothetical protein
VFYEMASLVPSPSSDTQPLDYSTPPSAKKVKYPPVVTVTPKSSGKLPRSHSQKFQHQQGQQQIQQNQYGPNKPNKNLTIADGLELHSGYSENLLVVELHSYEQDQNGVRSDFKVITMSAKEYNALKEVHSEILDDMQPSFDSGLVKSMSYDISSTLKIESEYQVAPGIAGNDGVYVITVVREHGESEDDDESSVKIQMQADEFTQLGKQLKILWFVFSKYPKNLEKSPLARKMLDRVSLEMIRMTTEEMVKLDADVISFDIEELKHNPEYASAFFKAYAKLTNFGYIHNIANEMAEEFDKESKEIDLFSLLYQCSHQIELLCTAMNVLFKSGNNK